jgi:uncharacterized membrane protein
MEAWRTSYRALPATIKQTLGDLAIKAFVDSILLHRLWRCHGLPERSFFVRGRQFHVCARCTGLIVGLPCSILLLPIREVAPLFFALFATALVADGLTQLAGWRYSNNKLRFATGFGTTITLLPSAIFLAGNI